MKNKKCGNCQWYNGEIGYGEQFCDELETFVHEDFICNRWKEKEYYEED